jgi:hypothetical protein
VVATTVNVALLIVTQAVAATAATAATAIGALLRYRILALLPILRCSTTPRPADQIPTVAAEGQRRGVWGGGGVGDVDCGGPRQCLFLCGRADLCHHHVLCPPSHAATHPHWSRTEHWAKRETWELDHARVLAHTCTHTHLLEEDPLQLRLGGERRAQRPSRAAEGSSSKSLPQRCRRRCRRRRCGGCSGRTATFCTIALIVGEGRHRGTP